MNRSRAYSGAAAWQLPGEKQTPSLSAAQHSVCRRARVSVLTVCPSVMRLSETLQGEAGRIGCLLFLLCHIPLPIGNDERGERKGDDQSDEA